MSDPVRRDDSVHLARRRRRPLNAVTAGAPAWTDWIGWIGFGALLTLTLLGPLMTNENTGVESQIRTAGYATILFLALLGLEPWRKPERLLVVPWPLLLALAWCWLSLSWAIEPTVGLRRLVLTTIVLWSTMALVRKLGAERVVLFVRIALVITLIVNYLVVFLDPAMGIHPQDDADLAGHWRGFMSQKNYAGFTCAMTIIAFAFNASAVRIAIRAAVIAGAAVFLYLSASKTSQIMTIVALAFGGAFALLAERKGREQLAPTGAAWILLAIPAALFVSMALDVTRYLEMVSDPSGFTGRTQIWTALLKFYADYPLTGAGFGSFWDLGPTGPIHQYARGWVVTISQGHNGYLDLLVTIGLPGTLLVLFATFVWPTQRLLRGGDHPVRPLAAAMFLFCLGHNLTEAMLFDRDALSQVFLLIALALLWIETPPPSARARPSVRQV